MTPLPYLVTAVGLGSFLVGLFSILRSGPSPDVFCANAGIDTNINQTHPQSQKTCKRLLQHLAIRNFTLGTSILAITYYWRFILANASLDKRDGVQRVLGILLTVGWAVSAVDGYYCGIAATEMMANHDIVDENAAFAQNMALVHRVRGFFWLGAGVWCIFGAAV